MMALSVTRPRDGDLLSPADGRWAEGRLWVTVEGTAPPQSLVTVNGVTVNADAGRFACELPVDAPTLTLTATCGEQRAAVTVYRLADPSPVACFTTDDNILWLRDLASDPDRYPSLFDHSYLAFWRELHRRYGLRVQHNLYWHDAAGFTLDQMPDRWRGEFADHADWLRLTFHAAADEPPRPYEHATAEQVLADYDRVTDAIVRFAGTGSLSAFTTLHWGAGNHDVCAALASRGVRGLVGYFHRDAAGEPSVAYCLNAEQAAHLGGRDAWLHHKLGLWFLKHDLVANCWLPAQIQPQLDAMWANPHRRQMLELMIHEQYFRPELHYFQPDAQQRVIQAVEWLAEKGARPAFKEELGLPE